MRMPRASAAAGLIGLVLSAAAPASADQVISDDLIVDGKACVGTACADGESFANGTLKLKETNIRILLNDTSSPTGTFPANDWRLVANDDASGGLSHFSIEDFSALTTPFRIEAGAEQFSLYVDSGGDVGLGTSVPNANLHIVDGDTPTLRLEQDGSSGFDRQVWDLLGNENLFLIRDATGDQGPFAILSGAVENSIVIAASGKVGLGTNAPVARLDVRGDAIVDGDFSAGSSRHIKHHFESVESRAVLEHLVELPITEWSYLPDSVDIRHLGPVSEDFSAAFGLGRDDRHISPVDLGGVAFASIQGLYEMIRERDGEIEAIRRSRDELAARLAALERRVAIAPSDICP